MIWPVASLDDIAESIDYGFTASATTEPIGPKFLRITDIQDGHVDWQSVPHSSERPTTNNFHLRPGDIVFARTGATTGKSFLIRDCPANSIFASYLIRVRVSSAIDPLFLAHFFQSTDYWTQIRLSASGAVQPGVNSTVLKRLRVPLPPLDEQRRIATILDQADDLRRKRRLALEKLNALSQAIFQEMFGDPTTNPRHFPTAPIVSVGRVVTGRTPPSGVPGLFGDEVPFVTPGDLGIDAPPRRSISESGAALTGTIRAGAALVCCIGTIGKMDIASTRCAFNQQINAIEWSQGIDDLFGYIALTFYKSIIIGRASTTTLPILKKSSFEKLEIPVPPLSEQKRFGQTVSRARSLFRSYRAHKESLDMLFTSLQRDAFVG